MINQPQVIILNGVSSAGKTSLARTLVQKLTISGEHISLDCLIGELNDDMQKNPIEHRDCINKILFSTITQHVEKLGYAVVDVLLGKQDMDTLYTRTQQAGLGIYSLCLMPDLETIEKREQERKNRPIGLGRQQYGLYKEDTPYNLIVDNSDLSIEQTARHVLFHMRAHCTMRLPNFSL